MSMITRPDVSQINYLRRDLGGRLGDVAAPEDFGAVGDGVADDTAALTEALSGGGHIRARQGAVYRVTNRIPIVSDTVLDLTGAVIDSRAMSSQGNITTALRGSAEFLSRKSLSVSATAGEVTVSAQNTGLSNGDMVVIGSGQVFDSINTQTRVAEIAVVRSATLSTVTLQAPLAWGYSVADGAYIQPFRPVENVSIIGGEFRSPSVDGSHDIVVYGGYNIRVDGCRFVGGEDTNVAFVDCILSSVSNCSFHDSPETDSHAYGIIFSNATQDCIASGNRFYNRRHAFTTGNPSAFYSGDSVRRGITRRCKVVGNVVYRAAIYNGSSFGDALDSHGGCDEMEFLDNTVYGATFSGINFEGRGCIIRGNHIYGSGAYGIRCHNETDFAGDIVVEGNVIHSSVQAPIRVEEGYRGASVGYRTVRISDNTVSSGAGVDGIVADVSVPTSVRPLLTVSGNTVNAGGIGVSIGLARNATVSSNSVRGSTCILLNGSPNGVTVSGNSLDVTGASGRGIDTRAAVKCIISGNTIRMPSAGTGEAIILANDGESSAVNNVVSNNIGISLTVSSTGIVQPNTASNTLISGNNMVGFLTPISAGSGTGHVVDNNIT